MCIEVERPACYSNIQKRVVPSSTKGQGKDTKGVQRTEHGPSKSTETSTWAQSQRQSRLHNPRIPYTEYGPLEN